MIYNKIYDFCKIRNFGGALQNGLDITPRLNFIIGLISGLNIKYELIKFSTTRYPNNHFYNIYIRGDSDLMVIAHHDVLNHDSDNANDNSASIINCISLKLLNPSINIAIIDGEEPPCMGLGSDKLSQDILSGYFGNIRHVLNLELTGKGGETFFVGDLGSDLEKKLIEKFDPFVIIPPFNDSYNLLRYGIDSTVITTIPLANECADYSIMHKIHSKSDSVDSISVNDMKIFTEKILLQFFNI